MRNPCSLTASDVQVLLADVQPQLVARSKTNDAKTIALSTSVLVQLAKVFSLPVTVSLIPQGEDREPAPIAEISDDLTGAPQFIRTCANPFLDDKTKAALDSSSRKTLIIAGVPTEMVVIHAATAAITLGYRVLVPVDACGGTSERTERAALGQIEAFGGEVTGLFTIGTALAPDFTSDLGKQMLQVVQRLRQT